MAINGEEVSYVTGGPGVNSQQIAKNSLNFKKKAWWTLAHLCPTIGGNVLSPVHAALMAGLITGYEFDIAQFISWEICDRVVDTDKVILPFPFLLM